MASPVASAADPVPPGRVLVRDAVYSAADGLALHARDYGDPVSPWLPVVCLPGLTRTARDFDTLAVHLSTHPQRPRRVVAFDYRGRGASAWDPRRAGYNPVTETSDIFDGMAALGIPRAAVVGTSRGGIVAILMATARPSSVAAIVFNDIGPAVEARGLARLKTYVGRTPIPANWGDAAQIQRRLHGGQFTAWDDADWDHFARLTYAEEGGLPASDYDPALADTLAGVDFDRPVPALWNEFRALGDVPMLAIRGENSDILSEETLAAMVKEHPGMETVTIAREGHPPLLCAAPLLSRIAAFMATAEDASPRRDAGAVRFAGEVAPRN